MVKIDVIGMCFWGKFEVRPKIGHFPSLIKHFHGSFMCVFITVVSPVVICMRKSYISCVALQKKIKYHEWDTLYFRSLRSEVM